VVFPPLGQSCPSLTTDSGGSQFRAMAFSLSLACDLVGELEQRKMNFESITEKIETTSPAGRLVFHIFAALAEFERNLIRERTYDGLEAARARGRKGGRPAKLSAKDIKTIRASLKTAGIPVTEIATRFGIARSTLYRVVNSPPA
jgi:DNA invertase Pin-like site-specific DNA recombinase